MQRCSIKGIIDLSFQSVKYNRYNSETSNLYSINFFTMKFLLPAIIHAQFMPTSTCIVSPVLLFLHSDCIYSIRTCIRTMSNNPKPRNPKKKTGANISTQGIRFILSNTSFLLLKYTYIQGYIFQLRGAIIRPLP